MIAVADLWGRGTAWSRGGSLALLLVLSHDWAFTAVTTLFLLLVAVAFLALVVWHRGLGRLPAHADWPQRVIWNTFLSACVLLVVHPVLVMWYVSQAPRTADVPLDPVSLPRMVGLVVSRLLWCVAICYAAGGLGRVLGYARRFQLAVVSAGVVYLAVRFCHAVHGNPSPNRRPGAVCLLGHGHRPHLVSIAGEQLRDRLPAGRRGFQPRDRL
jgi:hypothetical protein